MLRRALLSGAAAFALAPGAAVSSRAGGKPGRRVRPGDLAWPKPEDWAGLRRQLSGELSQPKPLLAACQADAHGDACREGMKHLFNPYYIGDQAAGTQVSGWYRAWTPRVSAFAVAAKGAADVSAAVRFAAAHNLRLVVKGGGHSYQGTSNAPDSLLIWTRPMRGVTLHDAFTPKGCEGAIAPMPAVSVEAGAVWMDVYDAVTTRAGRYAQGGGCTTVGVAGHVQSGGFGSWSKAFGTAAANLLEAEVVTADGAVRVVNVRRDPELFWALKGGGGGSFGVVTRVTLRTFALPDHFGGAEGTVQARSDEAFRRLLRRFVAFCGEALCTPHWGEQAHVRPSNALRVTMVAQGLDEAAIRAVWRPFLDWVALQGDLTISEPFEFSAAPARRMWDVAARKARGSTSMRYDDRPGASPTAAWWDGDQGQVGAFLHGYDSLWLPADLLGPSNGEALARALFDASRAAELGLHFNKGLAGAPADALKRARDTATHPGALGAFALVIVANGGLPAYAGVPWKAPADEVARRDADAVDRAMVPLRAVAPAGGSYVSESNYFNADWRDAFWGPNYPRLRRAKARYDPDGLFIVHHGVGSEDWSDDGFVRRA